MKGKHLIGPCNNFDQFLLPNHCSSVLLFVILYYKQVHTFQVKQGMVYSKQIMVESYSDCNQRRKKGKGVDFMEIQANQQPHTLTKSINGDVLLVSSTPLRL